MVKNINKRYRKLEYTFVDNKPKSNKLKTDFKKETKEESVKENNIEEKRKKK